MCAVVRVRLVARDSTPRAPSGGDTTGSQWGTGLVWRKDSTLLCVLARVSVLTLCTFPALVILLS